MSVNGLMLAMLFGSIGMGYIVYGRRQQKGIALFSGVSLCVYPYFVSNTLAILLIGLALVSAPIFRND